MTQRRIYPAARFSRRAEIAANAEDLRDLGHIVTARWISEGAENTYELLTKEQRIRCMHHDYQDICKADTLIAFTEHPDSGYSHGGRHVEYGMAFALGLRLIIVGPRENVFHWDWGAIPAYPDWDTCLREEFHVGQTVAVHP